jgi:hypothetical protein
MTEFSAGADYRFRPTMMTAGSISYADYTDGNNRFTIEGRFEWRPVYRAPIGIRNRFRSISYAGYLGFAEQLDNGYFNPDDYLTIYERLEWELGLHDRLVLMVAGRIGVENENFGDTFLVGALDGYATWRFVRDLSLTAGYFNSQSRLDTRSGYQADGWYVTLDFLWVY